MLRTTTLTVLLSAATALAQTTIYIPDNNATVGTCNAIPLSASFGSGASTYVGRIPASFLDPNNRTVRDVEFAPCSSGTFSAPNVQIGIGHVPNPVPNPFTFPTFDAAGNVTATGSFLDYSPMYNSVAQGPFTWTMTANTWSPFGLGTGSSPGFTWDGTNDIGFFITYGGGTGGSSCHRTTTEPFRLYASGAYQGTASTGSGAAGLKIGLVMGWPMQCAGCGGVTLGVSGSAALGGTLTASMANFGNGLPFVGIGFGPFCYADLCPGCPIGHGWQVALFGNTTTLSIPNNPIYIGMQVGFQGIGLLTPGGCTAPMVAMSGTTVVTVTP